jgi:peptidoglycan-N-acetylglucosamine deacetylase
MNILSVYRDRGSTRRPVIYAARVAQGDARVISGVELDRERKLVALTFDDGPSRWTASVLDALGRHGARATFFLLGRHVPRYGDVLRRAVGEGHELGNHLLTHRSAEHLEKQEVLHELVETGNRVRAAAGVVPRLVRPPYGADCERVARIAAEIELGPTVFWTFTTKDWRAKKPEPIVEKILGQVTPGAVVLMHDAVAPQPRPWNRRVARATRSRRPTIAALAEALDVLTSDGYRFVTVSELLEAGRP